MVIWSIEKQQKAGHLEKRFIQCFARRTFFKIHGNETTDSRRSRAFSFGRAVLNCEFS